jgi:hypothetical protein
MGELEMRRRYDKDYRRSIRLRAWDYARPGAYFITICTHQCASLFDDGHFREIVENGWRRIPDHKHARRVVLDEWVVMPNHLYGTLIILDDPTVVPTGGGPIGLCGGDRGEFQIVVRPADQQLAAHAWRPGVAAQLL